MLEDYETMYDTYLQECALTGIPAEGFASFYEEQRIAEESWKDELTYFRSPRLA